VADSLAHPRQVLTEEDLALLSHSDLVEDRPDAERPDELNYPAPPGFRERLLLGDISW
jgi:hypothetical protein